MLIRVLRFLTLILMALLMGMTFAHVLELPAKMSYDPSLYLSLQRTLYFAFGAPNIGAFIEIGAVVAVIILALLRRRQKRSLWLTLVAAISVTLALIVFFAVVEPANEAMRSMAFEDVPASFSSWRLQWEYGQATRFALHLIGFVAVALTTVGLRAADTEWSRRASQNTITPTRDRAEQWHRRS